jgi:biofilm PGA synthesis N-glycosyltransferase PgaC
MPYIATKFKFISALLLATLWMFFSIWFSQPWLNDLSQNIGTLPAYFLIGLIAIIPGFMNAFLVTALLLDKRPKIKPVDHYPGITILVAAYNEEDSITETVQSLAAQQYPGPLQIVVINDGSKDTTADKVRALLPTIPELTFIDVQPNSGKANALNQGLKIAEHPYVITVDGDCLLWNNALKNIVGRMLSDPQSTKAVAGSILIRNSRFNWITKAQEWDYFLGIGSIKRVQSLFQGTLVAQGAFSIYEKNVLLEIGGWPETVGEDIVLTWKILQAGHRVGHAENAVAFTRCPDTYIRFARQRQRWSRGLIEAFKATPGLLLKRRMPVFYIWWNTLFPFIDFAYTIGFIPGLVLALFGVYWIVGPMTLALLPMVFLMNLLMYKRSSATFKELNLTVRRNHMGLIVYSLVYSLLLQPACVWGYVSEFFNLRKTWGTK